MTKTIYSSFLCDIYYYRAFLPVYPDPSELNQRDGYRASKHILALEQTETVTQDGFLKNVLRVAVPGAVVMVIDMLLNQLLGIFFGFSSDILSTYNLLVAGCISMMVPNRCLVL